MRQNPESAETTNPKVESNWEVTQEEPRQAGGSLAIAILNGWNRFNVRHLLLWMVAIAFAIGANRGFKAVHLASLSSFLTAWFSASLDM